MPTDDGEEIRRFEYRGHILIGRLFRSKLPYGAATFASWEITRLNPDGTTFLVGYESSEQWAMLVVDYILDGKAKLRP